MTTHRPQLGGGRLPLANDVQLAKSLGISCATFWRRVKDGTFPQPIKIGGASRWPVVEFDALIEKAMAERDAAAAA